MNDMNVNICIPGFGYDVDDRTRAACAQAIARELEFAGPELHEYRIRRVEVRNVCCVSDESAGHVFAAALRAMDLTGAKRVADIAPEQLNVALLTTLRNFRVDMYRVDLGSLNPTDFHNLGRAYDANVHGILAKALAAFDMHNWCAVLDVGIRGQKPQSVDDCLARAFELAPGAVELRMADIAAVGEGAACELYERMSSKLAEAGYAALAPRLFLRPGYERCFEVSDGEPPEYWGFGPGAISYMDGCTMGVVRTVGAYIALMQNDEPPTPGVLRLDDATRARNRIRHGLEAAHGLGAAAFRTAWGTGFDGLFDDLAARGLACWQEGRLVPTVRGIVAFDQVVGLLDAYNPGLAG